MNQDTICAIATAQGGAIGSIRVSGPEAERSAEGMAGNGHSFQGNLQSRKDQIVGLYPE